MACTYFMSSVHVQRSPTWVLFHSELPSPINISRAPMLSQCMYVWVIHMAEYGSTGKVANPARGQLNREKHNPLSLCVPESLVSRDGFSRPVPRQPVHLHTQAESGAYVRDSSRVWWAIHTCDLIAFVCDTGNTFLWIAVRTVFNVKT